jgi:octaprenyl-diphosphate synthase
MIRGKARGAGSLERACVPIRNGMAAVERLILERTDPRLAMFARGKRLRPALLLSAARAETDAPGPDAITVAAVVEMVHTASLIHDDVLDGSMRRRGATALHRLIGVKPAVILADYLFVRGLSLLEQVKAAYLVPEVVREVTTMCEGQWLEVSTTRAREATEGRYLEVVEKKTASLFAFCCRTGGLLGRAGAAQTRLLGEFGLALGMAYQLLDDASDLEADAGVFGRQIARWGGRRFLRSRAREYARRAGTALAQVRDPRRRRGLGGIMTGILEVSDAE